MFRGSMMEDINQRLLNRPPPPSTTTRTNTDPVDANPLLESSIKTATTLNLQGELVHVQTTRRPEENKQPCVNCLLLKAIDLNCKGVCLLESVEDEERAIAIFKRSLVCVKSAIVSERSSATSTFPDAIPRANVSSRSQDLNDEDESRKRTKLPGAVSSPPEYSNHCDADHHHPMLVVPIQIHKPRPLDDLLYVYTKAFVFQTCSRAGNQEQETEHHSHLLGPPCCSIVDSELLSATIIYNIGLALHFKAIRTSSTLLRQRSIGLYEMSMGLLHRILKGKDKDSKNDDDSSDHVMSFQADLTHESMDILTSLLIACSNNVGHLSYYMQDDYERSCRALTNLKFLLKLFWTKLHESNKRQLESSSPSEPRRSSTSFLSLLERDDIRGFTWNVMFMYPAISAPAA